MKTKFILSTAILTAAFVPASAFAGEGYDVTVGVDAVSEYIFRGVKLGDESIQPYIEVAIGDLTVGTWVSTGFGKKSTQSDDEIDIYASYGFALGDTVSASVGSTLYHYPEYGGVFEFGDNFSGVDDASTLELSAGAEFDYVLAPSVTAYYDLNLDAFTLEGGLSHSVPMGEVVSLDLGLTAGAVMVDGPGDYEYGLLSAGVGYPLTDAAEVHFGANYSLSSEDTLSLSSPDDNSLWLGAGISSTF